MTTAQASRQGASAHGSKWLVKIIVEVTLISIGVTAYYGDLVIWEPELLKQYNEILPVIDRALGEQK